MIITIPFKNSQIRVKDEGNGYVIVLLHGYLENLDIWNGFAAKLAQHNRVISIDIPGHGQSGVVAEVHTMSLMASAVDTVLEHLGIERCILVGHSMGGYVLLAYLAEFPKRLAGVCLFHSSPLADSEEKRESRAKEIALIRRNKLTLICNTTIPNGFAADNLSVMADKVEFAKDIARQTSPEGAIAIIEGMRSRPDRQDLLQHNSVPVLFILGRKDNYVSLDNLLPLVQSLPNTTIEILEQSGHSGYLEEPDKSLEYIRSFCETSLK